MAQKKPTTYARNAEQIARAMGLPLTRGKKKLASLATVAQWVKEPTFPKKTPKGWLVMEVRKWVHSGKAAARTPNLPPSDKPAGDDELFITEEVATEAYKQKLEKDRRIFLGLDKSLFPLRVDDIKRLERHGLIPKIPKGGEPPQANGQLSPESRATGEIPESALSQGTATTGEAVTPAVQVIPDRIGKQSQLAAFLHGYFRDRIKINIRPQTLDQWGDGLGLRPVFINGQTVKPPKFPNKEKGGGNFYDTHECIEWVENYIVPVHGRRQGAGADSELPGIDAIDFDDAKREHELWKMKQERDIASGALKPVAEVNASVDLLGINTNRAITEFAEKIPMKSLADRLKGIFSGIQNAEWQAQLEGLWPQVELMIGEECRGMADRLRAAVCEAVSGSKLKEEPVAQ